MGKLEVNTVVLHTLQSLHFPAAYLTALEAGLQLKTDFHRSISSGTGDTKAFPVQITDVISWPVVGLLLGLLLWDISESCLLKDLFMAQTPSMRDRK